MATHLRSLTSACLISSNTSQPLNLESQPLEGNGTVTQVLVCSCLLHLQGTFHDRGESKPSEHLVCAQQGQLRERCSSWAVLQKGCLQAGEHPRCGGVIKRWHAALLGEAKPLGGRGETTHPSLQKENTEVRREKQDTKGWFLCVCGVALGSSRIVSDYRSSKVSFNWFRGGENGGVCVLVYVSACICSASLLHTQLQS